MAKLLNKLFWHTSAKLAVINWLLASMPESTKRIVIDRVLAKQLPKLHIHSNPKRKAA
jgi:hypothetical protein